MRRNLHSLDTLHHESCSYSCLVLANVCLAEEKLSIKVGDVDPIQVNHVDVFNARESKVLEDFAAQTTSPNHQHTCVFLKTRQDVSTFAPFEVRTECTLTIENSNYVTPPRVWIYFNHFWFAKDIFTKF